MARARRGARRGEPNKMSVGGGCSTSGDQSARTWLLIELTQFTWSRIMTRSWLARWGMTETEVGVTISHNGDHTLNCGRLKEQTKQCLITKPVRSLPRTSAGYNCRVSNDNPLLSLLVANSNSSNYSSLSVSHSMTLCDIIFVSHIIWLDLILYIIWIW